jgi:molybdopterin molybdotransferase
MAQLRDDCFAFSGPLMPIAQLEQLIAERIKPVAETETVALSGAAGRILAQDVTAPVDLPPFDNSAVDGFAVAHRDMAHGGETRLAVVDRVQAGHRASTALKPGQAVRIFTGAPVPSGADTVFMQEDCRVEGDHVIVPPGLKRGANLRPAGEDIGKGTVALVAGRRLRPQDIALLSALGVTAVAVRRRLRAAVFSTGDEIVEPGGVRGPVQIYDANRHLIRALLEKLGVTVTDLGILVDEPQSLRTALAAAARDHDLIVTSGGVSTGEADHVRDAVEQAGKLVLWRVGIKPGRPVMMGVIDGAAVIGLPGNPAAVFVTFVKVARRLALTLAGAAPETVLPLPVRCGFAYRKRAGRREYVRVFLRRAADGGIEALKFEKEGAGILTSLTETDGLLELGDDVTTVAPGETVGFLSYASLTN